MRTEEGMFYIEDGLLLTTLLCNMEIIASNKGQTEPHSVINEQ